VTVLAKDALQALSMESKSARPSRSVTSRERLEPWLHDRFIEARAPTALPFLRSQATLGIALQLGRVVAGSPHTEVQGKGERRAANRVRDARAEGLEV
jgi:hypothetical protein